MTEPFCQTELQSEPARQFVQAVEQGDADRLRELLTNSLELRLQINEPWFAFDAPAVVAAKHDPAVIEVLLTFGADINARSQWWAGGFGVLDGVERETAEFLIARGAHVDVHSACALGMLNTVRKFIASDPGLVNTPGADGQRPLHFASSIELIDLLLDNGAEIDARDLDHSATAAQYHVSEPELCRHLLARGARPDIYMACALGDRELVESLLDAYPDALTCRIGNCRGTRPIDPRSSSHVYAWKLKGAATPLEVAYAFGHQLVFDEIYRGSPLVIQFLTACWLADESEVRRILQIEPDLMNRLDDRQSREMARAAWDGRINSVRVMVQAGFDPHLPGDEESTPLDRAAFHGHREIVELLLEHDPEPPLAVLNFYGSTPLGTCCYGNLNSWKEGTDHLGTAEALIRAGSIINSQWIPTGDEAMDELLRRHVRIP